MRHCVVLRELAHRIASSPSYPTRVVGLNLLYETRAVAANENEVGQLIAERGSDSDRLERALKQYVDLVRLSPANTFARAENDENSIHIDGEETLIHVWNATKFLTRVGLDCGVPEAVKFISRARIAGWQPNDISEWLHGLDRIPNRLPSLIRLHNEYRIQNPWHPVWAARYDQAKTLLKPDNPNSWLDAVGLQAPISEPHLLIMFRYKARRAIHVRRPTQLEAGWFPLHFPSPPCASVHLGGFSMCASEGASHGGLVSEFIHSQLDWGLEDVLYRGWTTPSKPGDLSALRLAHFNRLQTTFQAAIVDWMTHPDVVPAELLLTTRK